MTTELGSGQKSTGLSRSELRPVDAGQATQWRGRLGRGILVSTTQPRPDVVCWIEIGSGSRSAPDGQSGASEPKQSESISLRRRPRTSPSGPPFRQLGKLSGVRPEPESCHSSTGFQQPVHAIFDRSTPLKSSDCCPNIITSLFSNVFYRHHRHFGCEPGLRSRGAL